MLEWSTASPAVSAAFLASIVEVVEAFTIVLVVATGRTMSGTETILWD